MKKMMGKIGFYVGFACCMMLVCAVSADAYLDPSVMTYVIQAGVGIVVAVGAAVGIYWRKARRKINDKLGVDENANKEVEEDIVIK